MNNMLDIFKKHLEGLEGANIASADIKGTNTGNINIGGANISQENPQGASQNIILDSDMQRKTKTQIHRFGEGIKAANELVGCLQVLNAKLNKLQTIISKIEFSLEGDSNDPANVNMSEILILQAKELIANTKFVDKYLFDTELSASMGEHSVSFDMPSPAPFLEQRDFDALNKYIDSKKDEIKASMESIRVLSNSDTSLSARDVSINKLRGKTIGEALGGVLKAKNIEN